MDKLKLAHDYALKLMGRSSITIDEVVRLSFDYADAMQAEADKRINKERPDVLNMADSPQLEWQPDWSQAPDDLVKYFAVDEDGRGGWYINKPDLCFDHWYWSGLGERVVSYEDADNFGYQGNWQDSLRERPHGF